MRGFYCKFFVLFAFVFFQNIAQAGVLNAEDAENAANDELISLFGESCETVKSDEAKSSVRVRATDKASFKAVEVIPELGEIRSSFPSHDFNVLVYSIVDNYIEDLSAKTSKQTDDEICVEVTGFLNGENILRALSENRQRFSNGNENGYDDEKSENPDYPNKLEIEDVGNILPAADFPPAPQLNIKKEVSVDTLPAAERTGAPVPMPERELLAEGTGNAAVYIAPTHFFNNTSTEAYFDDLKNIVLKKNDVEVISDPKRADYILYSDVLRAKVEAINAKTNRLQMVISLKLTDVAKNISVTEHQNRFILFESSDDEQQVAGDLMKKLFDKAGDAIIGKIKPPHLGALTEQDAIITPSNPNRVTYP